MLSHFSHGVDELPVGGVGVVHDADGEVLPVTAAGQRLIPPAEVVHPDDLRMEQRPLQQPGVGVGAVVLIDSRRTAVGVEGAAVEDPDVELADQNRLVVRQPLPPEAVDAPGVGVAGHHVAVFRRRLVELRQLIDVEPGAEVEPVRRAGFHRIAADPVETVDEDGVELQQ